VIRRLNIERKRKGEKNKRKGIIPLLTCIKGGWIPESTGFYTVLLGFHRNGIYF